MQRAHPESDVTAIAVLVQVEGADYRFQERMRGVVEYMQYREMPADIKRKVRAPITMGARGRVQGGGEGFLSRERGASVPSKSKVRAVGNTGKCKVCCCRERLLDSMAGSA
jgi:hypothetical protein